MSNKESFSSFHMITIRKAVNTTLKSLDLTLKYLNLKCRRLDHVSGTKC